MFDDFLAATGLTDVCGVLDCGTDADRIDKFLFRSGGGITLEPLDHTFERERFVRPTDGEPLSDHERAARPLPLGHRPGARADHDHHHVDEHHHDRRAPEPDHRGGGRSRRRRGPAGRSGERCCG